MTRIFASYANETRSEGGRVDSVADDYAQLGTKKYVDVFIHLFKEVIKLTIFLAFVYLIRASKRN